MLSIVEEQKVVKHIINLEIDSRKMTMNKLYEQFPSNIKKTQDEIAQAAHISWFEQRGWLRERKKPVNVFVGGLVIGSIIGLVAGMLIMGTVSVYLLT